jgi:Domain of unknown function (DUF5004)
MKYCCLLCLVWLFGCTYIDKKKTIIQKWKLVSVILENQKTDYQDSLSHNREKIDYQTTFEFKTDTTYTLLRGTQSDSGRWSISSDESVLILQSQSQSKDNAEFKIRELNQYRMELILEEKGKIEHLILEPLR